MKAIDRAALKLAIEITRAESPARRQQIDNMLRDRPWREVAEFASYCAQGRSLHLRPWQTVPCALIDSDLDGDPLRGGEAAAELLDRMAKLGISRWHPTPLEAIAEAEAPRGSLTV